MDGLRLACVDNDDVIDVTTELSEASRGRLLQTLRDGRKVGFSWGELVQLLIKYGLPALIQIIQAIINGETTKEAELAKLTD